MKRAAAKAAPKKSFKGVFDKFPTVVKLDPLHRSVQDKVTKKFLKEYEKNHGFSPEPRIGMPVIVYWSEKGTGFGEFVFFMRDGKVHCANECMSRESVKRILCTMVDQAVFLDEEPKKKAKKK